MILIMRINIVSREGLMPTCSIQILARHGSCSVERCSCGHIRLNLGPTTVRLDPETFRSLAALVGSALLTIDCEPRAREAWVQ